MSHQQSFSYEGTGLPGLNQYLKLGLMCLAQEHNAVRSVRLGPKLSYYKIAYIDFCLVAKDLSFIVYVRSEGSCKTAHCAVLPEPLMLAYELHTNISCNT